jgi:hypothetical protein
LSLLLAVAVTGNTLGDMVAAAAFGHLRVMQVMHCRRPTGGQT